MSAMARLDWSMRILPVLLGLAVWAGAARPAAAATPVPKDLVRAELLADVASVKPGDEITLGVLLKIKPKWHIYWKYPGDAGLPTRVKWSLPDADAPQPELRFPMPVRFDQPGDVVGYGYKDEVLLTARVKAPQGAAGSNAEFAADVTWLVCADVCIPGKATVRLSIPLADKTTPANEKRFADWAAQLPQPAAAEASQSVLKDAQLEKVGEREFEAKVNWSDAQKLDDVQWFPVPPKGVGVEDAQTKSEGSGSIYSFALVPMPKGASTIQFLVTYTDSSGKRQGVEFNENLPAPLPK
jgi:DsbC/DsbD-like thiol-disulfide interchange protein